MSEVKIREEKCSLRSPCKDANKICNLDQGDCEYPSSDITFYIKNKGYTGDIPTIISKINKKYGNITNRKCTYSENADYIGKTYDELNDTLKEGDFIFFYNPQDQEVICNARTDPIKTKEGIVLTISEDARLRKNPGKNRFLTPNRIEKMYNLYDNVYIKRSQYHNLYKRGYNFFVVLRTNIQWISLDDLLTLGRTTVYMLVPISTKDQRKKKKLEKKYCSSSYIKYQNILLNKTKELYSAIVADEGNIKLINKKLKQTKDQLKNEPKNLVLKNKEIKLKIYYDIIEKMKGLKQSNKPRYPYWYSLSKPIGKKLLTLGELKPFTYNNHTINPVYKDKKMFLACQSEDLNYEVNLFVFIGPKDHIVYSQSVQNLYNRVRNNSNYKKYYKIPLNKGFPRNIRMTKKEFDTAIAIEHSKSKPVPIYCVEITSNFNKSKVYYSTSKNAAEQFFDGIVLSSSYYDNITQKSLIKIKMDKKKDNTIVLKQYSLLSEDNKEDSDEGDNADDFYGFEENIEYSQNNEVLKQQLVDSLKRYANYLLLHPEISNNQRNLLNPRLQNISFQFSNNNYATREIMLTTYNDYKRTMTDIIRRIIE